MGILLDMELRRIEQLILKHLFLFISLYVCRKSSKTETKNVSDYERNSSDLGNKYTFYTNRIENPTEARRIPGLRKEAHRNLVRKLQKITLDFLFIFEFAYFERNVKDLFPKRT